MQSNKRKMNYFSHKYIIKSINRIVKLLKSICMYECKEFSSFNNAHG